MRTVFSRAALEAAIGDEIGVSDWVKITQNRIDTFADVTEDWQAIHIDVEAAATSSFGGTVAHGFLTLSLLSMMAYDALPKIEAQRTSVNYGFDKVRFIAPVLSGARLRAHFTLDAVNDRPDGSLMVTLSVEVEIEGQDKPALVAEWRIVFLF